jgi:dynactin complex subunit
MMSGFTLFLFVWSVTIAIYFIILGVTGLISEKIDSKNERLERVEKQLNQLEASLKSK